MIAVGGALGSLTRWAVATAAPSSPPAFPWGTWVANISGAFLLGLLMVFLLEYWPPGRYVRPFLGVGFLGGYTTFSTYMLDTRNLLADGETVTALVYVFGSLILGLLAVGAGILLARLISRGVEDRHQRRRRSRQGNARRARFREKPDKDPDPYPDARSTK